MSDFLDFGDLGKRRSHGSSSFSSHDHLDAHDEYHFDLDELELADEEEHVGKPLSTYAPPMESWYHGRLDRQEAEHRLKEAGTGAYLVRESERKPGSYSLSFFGLTGYNHFRVTAVCGDYYIGGRQFGSLEELVGYYTKLGTLLKYEKLEKPVAPLEPVRIAFRIRAKLPYDRTPDSDELSFQKGDVFIVENIIDSDWVWAISQKDGKSGLVAKALTEELDKNADPYEGKEWFHDVSKEDANNILMQYGKVGSFIIRPRGDSSGDYSISLRDHKQVSRFLIKRQGRYFILGGRSFDSVDAIVERYKTECIAQGITLGDPLHRNDIDGLCQSSKSDSNDFTDYPAMPPIRLNSRGSDLIHKDRAKSGYLVKKGDKNKWKRVYFVLKGDGQHLCYYESEKRTKPKGLIDLCFSSVYTVHDSLFGRPNCFQVVVKALNETTIWYICTDTTDLAREWMEAISRFCGARKSKNHGGSQNLGTARKMKEFRSLDLSICDAHKLSPSKLPHPYCIVSLNDVKICRTKAQEGCSPVWSEDFKFDDLPTEVTSFMVSLYNRNKMKDVEAGRVTVSLNTLVKGEVLDQWFPLNAVGHKGEVGTIRLKARFVHEVIMPEEEYSQLKELLMEKDYLAASLLGDVSKDLPALANTLLRIFRHEKMEITLVQCISSKEIEFQEKKETLFRGNTLASKLLDQYMKMVAIPYLQQTIKDVVIKILDCKQSCELNPSRLEKGTNVVDNLQQLLRFLEEATESIFKSTDQCPRRLRYIFHCLQSAVKEKWPEEELIRCRVVSAFLFLRLICPAILNPKTCNLMNEMPSPMAHRTLTLVAMCLQKLANLVEFGEKESYLRPVNPFIQKYKSKMVEFLDNIASVSDCPPSNDVVTWDHARDLAAIHDICVAHEQQLHEINLRQPHARILIAISEGIKKQKEEYLQELNTRN